MEVTRQNFNRLLPKLKELLSKASFLAIDGEFTGLNSCGQEIEIKPFDTPQQYYEKEYQRALDFLIVQLGVCFFFFHKETQRYSHQAFNFYVFPATDVRGSSSSVFQCQSSSIAFLAKHGFNFNKAFGEGIHYLTQVDEDRLKCILQERLEKINSNGSSQEIMDIEIPEGKRVHLESNMALIQSFVDDSSKTKKDELVVTNCSALMRRLLYQEVRKKYGNTLYLETTEDLNILVSRNSVELREKRLHEQKLRNVKELDDAVGLSQFIKLLSASGKLIIGHNCLLDLCHVVNSFRFPLPADYNDFKEVMHHVFPSVLDTKHMAEQLQEVIPSTVLGHLLKTVNEPPFKMPSVEGETDKDYNLNEDKSHEAGYDAYITGLCFLSMCQYLCKERGKPFGCVEEMSELWKDFQNRLYLSRIQDVPFMQLGAPDRKPPRDHVFHLTFPQEWRQNEIIELFKPFGPVFVSFVDKQSAFVALHKRDQSALVLRSLTENNTYKLTSFADFQKQLNEKKFSLCTKQINFSNTSLADLNKKRKVLELVESPQCPGQNKKLCNQPKNSECSVHSSSLIQEQAERNTKGMDSSSAENEDILNSTCKEFPVNDMWD